MKTKIKNSLFLAIIMLSITTNTILAQTEKNLSELSVKELKKEGKNNNYEAITQLADIYLASQNHKKAYKLYHIAAENNNAKSQYMWGLMNRTNITLSEIDRLTVPEFWFSKSAHNNYPDAQYQMGLFTRGDWDYIVCKYKNVNAYKNLESSYNWFLRAALNNHPIAQYELAMLYYSKGNHVGYEKWMVKSAENKYDRAQLEIAKFYVDNKKFAKALYWAEIAGTSTNPSIYYILEYVKETIYKNNREINAAKLGDEGIAQLKIIKQKEYDAEKEEERIKKLEREERDTQWAKIDIERKEKRDREDKEDEKRWANKPSAFQQMLNEQNASTAKIHNDQNEMQKQIKVNQADATGTRNYESVMRDAEAKRKYEEVTGESFPTLTKTENASTKNASTKNATSEKTTSESTESDKSSSATKNSEPLIAKKFPDHIENARQAGKGNTETEACEDATKRVKEKHGTKLISIGNCYNIQKVYNHKGEQKGWFCYVDYSFNAQSLSDPNVKRKTTTSSGTSK